MDREASTEATPSRPFRIGEWTVKPATNSLIRNGEEVSIEPRLMRLLNYFVANAEVVISRERIVSEIWPDQHVAEEGVAVAVYELRKALGDNARDPRYIKTIRKAGFQLIAPIDEADQSGEGSKPNVAPTTLKARELPRWLLPALSVVLIIGFANRFLSEPASIVPTIAVMPFAYMAEDTEQTYFAAGLTEDLINDLALSSHVRVLPRRSVLRFADSTQGPREIGAELGVSLCIEGAVQVVEGHVLVTVQIVDTQNEKHVWAGRYEKEIRDFFRIRKEVAFDLVRYFSGDTSDVSPATAGNRSPDVYHSYLKGRYFLNKGTAQSAEKAITYFTFAVRMDSDYAEAYAGLAEAYAFFGPNLHLPFEESRQLAAAHARKALELDPRIADAHFALAATYFQREWRWQEAGNAFRSGLALHPTHVLGLTRYGLFLAASGQLDQGLAQLRDAAYLDPLAIDVTFALGLAHLLHNDRATAREFFARTVELEPEHMDAQLWLLLAKHEGPSAAQLVEDFKAHALSFQGNSDVALQFRAIHEALEGLLDPTNSVFTDDGLENVSQVTLAAVFYQAGHKEQAFSLLARAFAARDDLLVFADLLPQLQGIPDEQAPWRTVQQNK